MTVHNADGLPPSNTPVDIAGLDGLLAQVIAQARALGIPVSGRIAPQVQLNSRAKKRYGCCKGSPGGGFVIELAAALPAAGRAACMQTLAHEVLHTCPGCQNHGERWRRYAAQMNAAYGYVIRRADAPAALGLAEAPAPVWRWCITCTACGQRFYRQRASTVVRRPGRYRCSRCGGQLQVQPLAAQSAPCPARSTAKGDERP